MVKKMLMAAVIAGAMPLMADTEYANGYTWTYRIQGGTAVISNYDENWTEWYDVISPKPVGAVTIPSTLGGKPVTSIENFSADPFGGRFDGLTSLTIPASVKAISSCAFGDCQSVTSLTVPTWCKNAKYSNRGTVAAEGDDELSENEFLVMIFGCNCFRYPDDENRCFRHASQIKVTYKDVGGSEQGGGTVSDIWKTARTVQGAVYDGNDVIGIVELKLGKVNNKKGTGKVSGSVTTLDGKKHTIQAFNLTGLDGASPKAVSLEVRDYGTMSISIGDTAFSGSMGKYHVQSATVGGDWNKGGAKVYVDMESASLPAGTQVYLLPDGEPVVASGGKWKFAKAASVKWGKPKQRAGSQEVKMALFDANAGKGITVDTSAGKTNLSGMKLAYTPKKGTFKGSFKVYALEGEGKAKKLKKYTVKVSGVVVDGVGYGTATSKNPDLSCPVTVK